MRNKKFDLADEIKNGANICVTGRRGGGKTSTVIGAVQRWLKKDPENRYAILNVPMVYRDKDGNEKLATPPHVDSVSDIETLFRCICRIMTAHADNLDKLSICVVIDEGQNVFMGEMHTKAVPLTSVLGIWRKFCASCVIISPVLDNLLPRLRHFTISEGGYMTSQWIKSERVKVGDRDPRDFVWIRHEKGEKPVPVLLPPSSWCRPPKEGQSGYYYDHLGVSSLELERPKFTVPDLVNAISGILSKDVPGAMQTYFDKLDGKTVAVVNEDGEEEMVAPTLYDRDMTWVKRLREQKVDWLTIRKVTKIKNIETLQRRYQRWVENDRPTIVGELCDLADKKS